MTPTAYPFDPELAPIAALLPRGDWSDVPTARAGLHALAVGNRPEVDTLGVTVTDRTVSGPAVPVRVYVPEGRLEPGPALLMLHGGGFVLGSVELDHAWAVTVARALQAVVVGVGYRLAPEHPFPAAIDDCWTALAWLHAASGELGIDPTRIGVHGVSAGGGLAAALALLARDRGGPSLCFQALAVPELDDRLETPSMSAFVDTPIANRPAIEWSWQHYLGDDRSAVSPYAAPARAEDLSGLPPAYVSTMEFDPLRDEGIQYALRLLQAGGSVELHSYPGAFHGADQFADTAIGRRIRADLLAALGRGLRTTGAVQRHGTADQVAPADLLPPGLRDPLREVGLG